MEQQIHTHTFVGGPADGRKHCVPDNGDRGWVEWAETPGVRLTSDVDLDQPVETVAITRRIYNKAIIATPDATYLFWRDEDLSDAEAIAKLFERYAEPTSAQADSTR